MADGSSVGSSDVDADLEAIVVPSSVKVGGGALLFLGIMTSLLGVQTLLVTRFTSLTGPIIAVMLALGGACAVMGYRLTRGSGRAALIGTGVSGATFFVAAAWFVFSLSRGLFSLLALGLVPLSIIAVAASAVSIRWAQRADGARARLRAQGFDSGL